MKFKRGSCRNAAPLRRVACQQDSAPYQCRDDLLSVETKDSCRKLCVQIHPAGFANPLIGFQYRHGDLLSLLRLTRIDSPVRSLFGIRCCCYMEELNLTMLGCQLELYLPNREHLRNVGKIRRSVCGPQCHVRAYYVNGQEYRTLDGVRNNAKAIYKIDMIAQGYMGRAK